jgi:hypothetical protein
VLVTVRDPGRAPTVTGTESAGVEPQHAAGSDCGRRSDEQTPVSDNTSSTRRADAQSPAMALATDRACSYPVSMRKVGARP